MPLCLLHIENVTVGCCLFIIQASSGIKAQRYSLNIISLVLKAISRVLEYLNMKFLILAVCVIAAIADPHWVTLDDHEVAVVKSTWNSVSDHEIDILAAIFKAYPDIQSRFPGFAGKDIETLKTTPKFALHATRIVGFFSQYITLLGKADTQAAIKTILNEMGENHRTRGIPKDMFNEFRTAVFSYLKAHATGFNDDAAHAWGDAFDKMYYVIFSALDGHPVN